MAHQKITRTPTAAASIQTKHFFRKTVLLGKDVIQFLVSNPNKVYEDTIQKQANEHSVSQY